MTDEELLAAIRREIETLHNGFSKLEHQILQLYEQMCERHKKSA